MRVIKTYRGRVTRTLVALELLSKGPCTFAQILVLTGWTKKVASLIVTRLLDSGRAFIKNINGRRHYLRWA